MLLCWGGYRAPLLLLLCRARHVLPACALHVAAPYYSSEWRGVRLTAEEHHELLAHHDAVVAVECDGLVLRHRAERRGLTKKRYSRRKAVQTHTYAQGSVHVLAARARQCKHTHASINGNVLTAASFLPLTKVEPLPAVSVTSPGWAVQVTYAKDPV